MSGDEPAPAADPVEEEWSEAGFLAAGDIERAESRSALTAAMQQVKGVVSEEEYQALKAKGTKRWAELPAEDEDPEDASGAPADQTEA